MMFWLDCQVEAIGDTSLALHAVDDNGPWNGFPCPVVTAAEFRSFIARNQSNDPNGTWWPDGVGVVGRFLVYDDREHDEPDMWLETGDTDERGDALYELSGWTWTTGE